jgi:polysaccharide biosynthesis/export protein
LTVSQLRKTLLAGLEKYIVNPEVLISVSSIKSQSVVVLGEVDTPGLFPLEIPRTCIQMIALAGGFTKNARQDTVLLIRGGMIKPELITLDFKKVFQKQDFTQNISIRNGDIIYVPATKMENAARYFDHLQRILGTFYQAIFGGLVTVSATK